MTGRPVVRATLGTVCPRSLVDGGTRAPELKEFQLRLAWAQEVGYTQPSCIHTANTNGKRIATVIVRAADTIAFASVVERNVLI